MRKMIIFDMDGTIIESETLWRQAPMRLLVSRHIPVPRFCTDEYDFLRCRGTLHRMIDAGILDMSFEDAEEWCCNDMEEYYQHYIQPKPGAYELLEYLKYEYGLPMILITQTPQNSTNRVLEHLGFCKYFDIAQSTYKQLPNKGDAEFYAPLVAPYGVKSEECLLIDDSLYALRGAKAAGLEVWAVREEIQYPDRNEIQDISDHYFENCLEMMNAFKKGL